MLVLVPNGVLIGIFIYLIASPGFMPPLYVSRTVDIAGTVVVSAFVAYNVGLVAWFVAKLLRGAGPVLRK